MVQVKDSQNSETLVIIGKIKQVETQIREKNYEIKLLKKEIKRLEGH